MKEDKSTNKIIIVLFIIIMLLFVALGMKMFFKKSMQNTYNEMAKNSEELRKPMSEIASNLISNPETITEDDIVSNMEKFGETWEKSSVRKNMFDMIKQMLIVIVIIVIIYYICIAIGLQKIAKDEGYSSWQAWLPIFNIYLLYKIGFKDSKIKWAILAIFLTGTGTLALPVSLQIVIELLLIILTFISLYNIFSEKSDKALYMIIACVVASVIAYFGGLSLGGIVSTFGVIGPFLLVSVRNK